MNNESTVAGYLASKDGRRMNSWRLSLTATLLAAISCSGRADELLAITPVSVVDVAGGRVLADRTVLVAGETIQRIVPASEPLPAGARVVDGTGRWLVPGLFDAHVHLADAESFGALLALHGVTCARDMGSPTDDVLVAKGRFSGGSLLGPDLVVTGAMIDGVPAKWPFAFACANPDEGRAAVRELHEKGVGQVKVYTNLDPETYRAVVAEARSLGLTAVGHVPARVPLEDALEAGQRGLEHLAGFEPLLARLLGREFPPAESSRYWLALDEVPAAPVDALVDRLARSGASLCPTLVVADRIGRMKDPELAADPLLACLPRSIVAAWDPSTDFRFRDWKPEIYQWMQEAQPIQTAFVGRLHRAGVPIVAGTDLANPWLVPGKSLHDELRFLAEAGLSPLEVLRSATTRAAEACEVSDRLGTIEPGKTASMVLLSADPLDDAANLGRIEGVFLRGRWLDRAELDRIRSDLEAKAAAGASSQLAQVISAAFTEFAADEAAYAALHARYVGYEARPPEGDAGRWIPRDEVAKGSALEAVLERGRLRLGFHADPPYHYRGPDGDLIGFDRELGAALVERIRAHYPESKLELEWVERAFELPGGGQDIIPLFDGMFEGLEDGDYDVVLSGILRVEEDLGDRLETVDLCRATMADFPGVIYTGKDDLDVAALAGADRDAFIDFLARHPGLSVLSTAGGNSERVVRDLVADVAARGGSVETKTAVVNDLLAALRTHTDHFVIGDVLALGSAIVRNPDWGCRNLGIPADRGALETFQVGLGPMTLEEAPPAQGIRIVEEPFVAPEGVVWEREIEYARYGDRPVHLDVLRPAARPAAPVPALVWVHGGGFSLGTKQQGLAQNVRFAQRGWYTVTIEYRLSGEAKFPAAVHDCKAAVRWLRANAASLGVDPDRIAIWGSSSGGNLAALVGTSGGVADLEGDGGNPGVSSRVRCVVDCYGPGNWLSISAQRGKPGTTPDETYYYGDQPERASPVNHVTKGCPPFLIFHGSEDHVVPIAQSEEFYGVLKAAGVDATYVPILGAGHGWPSNPEVDRRVDAFFARHLEGAEVEISSEPIRVPDQGGR